MKIDELFKKAEKFIVREKSLEEKKEKKKEKLKNKFKKKIFSLNKKIKNEKDKKEKKVLMKQLHVMKQFLKKLKG